MYNINKKYMVKRIIFTLKGGYTPQLSLKGRLSLATDINIAERRLRLNENEF